MLNPKTKQGRKDLPKVRSGPKNKTYSPYPPRSSTVFSCNARMVWLFGSLAVYVQTLASASVVYSTSENDTLPRWTAPLNEQTLGTTHKTATNHQGMQVWGPGDKTDRDTSLGCASRPREGRVIQSRSSLHEAHASHHRSIVARMGTRIGSQ